MSNATSQAATPDLMTAAYIGYGLRQALDTGLEFDGDQFESEEALMQALVDCAPKLAAEWERRYGAKGLDPYGCGFVYYYEVAEPFGEQYARLLAEDSGATPDALIQELFNDADPNFNRKAA